MYNYYAFPSSLRVMRTIRDSSSVLFARSRSSEIVLKTAKPSHYLQSFDEIKRQKLYAQNASKSRGEKFVSTDGPGLWRADKPAAYTLDWAFSMC